MKRVIHIGVSYVAEDYFRKLDEEDECEIIQCHCSFTTRVTSISSVCYTTMYNNTS